LERELAIIKESNINEQNRTDILNFHRFCLSSNMSVPSMVKWLSHLNKLALMFEKPFREATKNDIVDLVGRIDMSDLVDYTKRDLKIILKRLYKWIYETDDPPEIVKWIKIVPKNSTSKLPEELLTEEEVKRLVEAADNPRDKALVLVLYESGCRIGELLPIKMKHVNFDEYGAVLMVSGKTGDRRVRIIASTSTLTNWLDNHPLKNIPDAPIWIAIGTRNRNNRMSYMAVHTVFRKLAKRANIAKKVNPHSFRHMRATYLANRLTEAQLKEMFGWTRDSKMASVYVHLSGRDVDSALLKLHGLVINGDKKEDVFTIKFCPRCKEKNDPVKQFCSRCGTPLDFNIALQSESRKEEADDITHTIVKSVFDDIQERYKIDIEKLVYDKVKELKLGEKIKSL
jgi:integrase